MSKIYPNIPPDSCPRSELKVREALSATGGFTAFHSVAWQYKRNGAQGDGEADFVVIAPDKGILILEVKGGGVEIEDGQWFTTNARGERNKIKDPFEQAKDSKYALLGYIKETAPELVQYPIVHGVVFPDITVDGSLAFNAPREILIDANELKSLDKSINRIFEHWGRAKLVQPSSIKTYVSLLAPTKTVKRLLSNDVIDVSENLIELTNQQMLVLHATRRMKRAVVYGGAGTGKTILATERARQLSADGLKTLLVCYNTPLKEYLQSGMADSNVEVESFHTLAIKVAKMAKIPLPMSLESEWFERDVVDVFKKSVESSSLAYDAILIDEAQDFSLEWIAAIEGIVRDGGYFLLFADSHQNLYKRGWTVPLDFGEYELSVNCRNSKQIAEKVAKLFGDQLAGKMANGPEPTLVEYERESQIIPYTINLLESLLLEQGLSAKQVVVLTDSNQLVKELRSMVVGPHVLTTLDRLGIPVETIHRFKGLERDVVILVLTNKMNDKDLIPLSYVGMSRARAMLYVVAGQNTASNIRW